MLMTTKAHAAAKVMTSGAGVPASMMWASLRITFPPILHLLSLQEACQPGEGPRRPLRTPPLEYACTTDWRNRAPGGVAMLHPQDARFGMDESGPG